jgi:quinoprotein glucose dehydrogenase
VKPARPLVRVDFVKERDLVRPKTRRRSTSRSARRCGTRAAASPTRARSRRSSFHEEGAPPKSTIQFPGGTGGVNWGGAAADPTSGYVYVNAHDTSLVGWIEAKRPG